MGATYIHLPGQELDKALQKLNGIKVEEEMEESKLKLITCVRCKTQNSAISRFCFSCGLCSRSVGFEYVCEKDGLFFF